MSARVPFVHSQRALRYELYALLFVALVPVALALVFPYEAIGFTAVPTDVPRRAACAFVSLSQEAEVDLLTANRAAWKVNAADVRRLRADLSLDDIPEVETKAVAEIGERRRPPAPCALRFDALPLPPSVAAPPPAQLPDDPASLEKTLAFPREELLKIEKENTP